MKRIITTIVPLLFASAAVGQGLTLEEAIEYAKANNGRISAAFLQYRAARSGVAIANSAFFPTLNPQYRFVDQQQRFSGGFGGTGSETFHQVAVGTSWLVLDGGQRSFSLARARNLADAAQFGAVSTLRTILFTVTQQFFDALRSQELLRVADAQVRRAQETLDVTKKQVEVGQVARKDILQAEADLANSVVQQITARNLVNTSSANLKASMGWEPARPLPVLVAPEEPETPPAPPTLEEAIESGLAHRPDLEGARKRLQADRYTVLTAARRSSFDWELTFNYSKNFEPEDADNRNLQFLVTYPLFDAGASREALRQTEFTYKANQELLEQQVRDARSEIEAVYLSWHQNLERLSASEKALLAAQENFKAASESQSEGVASILDVTNAQISLVTAETNYVQALYDFYISDAELRLVTGRPLLGE